MFYQQGEVARGQIHHLRMFRCSFTSSEQRPKGPQEQCEKTEEPCALERSLSPIFPSCKPFSHENKENVCVCACVDFVSMPDRLWPYRAAAPQWTCWRNAWNVPVCLSHPPLQLLVFQIHAPIQSTNLSFWSESLDWHLCYICFRDVDWTRSLQHCNSCVSHVA